MHALANFQQSGRVRWLRMVSCCVANKILAEMYSTKVVPLTISRHSRSTVHISATKTAAVPRASAYVICAVATDLCMVVWAFYRQHKCLLHFQIRTKDSPEKGTISCLRRVCWQAGQACSLNDPSLPALDCTCKLIAQKKFA